MRSRILLFVFDAFSLLAVAAVLSTAFAGKAYAYVDPSVMTYTIQALAGIAVALSTVLGVALRRTRKKLFKALGVDENARKEVEPRVHRVDVEGNVVMASEDAEIRPSSKRSAGVSKISKGASEKNAPEHAVKWVERLILSAVVGVFFVFTLFVVAPYEIVAGSEGSLVFGLDVVWPVMAKAAVVIAIALVAVLALLRGRVFSVAITLVFAIGVGFYIQAMFMNTGLPIANGASVDWQDYTFTAAWTSLVWLLVVVIPLALAFSKPKVMRVAAGALSLALVLVQSVGVASLFASNVVAQTEGSASEYVMTKEGLYSVSPESNVIVFSLDTYDTQFLLDSYNAHPEMLDEMTGFTWFQNSSGSMIPTRYGNVFLLTGGVPEDGENFQDFLAGRYPESSYLSDIKDAGYTIGIYTDTLGAEYLSDADAIEMIYDKTVNIKVPEGSAINEWGTFKALTQCAVYRDFPWVAKPFFWFYTDQVNRLMSNEAAELSVAPYTINDAYWYQQLQDLGLSIEDEGGVGSFRFIHLLGTHWPYSLDENGSYIGDGNVTLDQQAQGTICMVSEYLRQLKKLGVYENATIVITADHGNYYPVYGPLEEPTSPILLIKPGGQTADEAATPLATSQAPVWAGDVLSTVVDLIGGDASSYGPTVFDVPEGADRIRYYLETTNDEKGSDVDLLQYEIDGNVLDFEDWTLTGKTWSVWG